LIFVQAGNLKLFRLQKREIEKKNRKIVERSLLGWAREQNYVGATY
jgi:hypothetical protein